MKFEYKKVACPYDMLDEIMQSATNVNWELVHVASSGVIASKDNLYLLIFKKPKYE